MTDIDFIKSISNVPNRPLKSTVSDDSFGRRAMKDGASANGPAFTEQPSPPWEHEPETPRSSIGWVMGSGAEYRQQFKKWFTSLDTDNRDAFIANHPEPEGWRGFYGSLIEAR